MGKRRKARELALCLLYQLEFHPGHEARSMDCFWSQHPCAQETRQFASRLVMGVSEKLEPLDSLIQRFAEHWTLDRIALVDKNILRLGIYELLFREDIPKKASLNEAIEIAKLYGSEDSGKFINGILDRIMNCSADEILPWGPAAKEAGGH
jgi:N utilization substance protein B